MFDRARIKVSGEDRAFLSRLSGYVAGFGRYPMGLDPRQRAIKELYLDDFPRFRRLFDLVESRRD